MASPSPHKPRRKAGKKADLTSTPSTPSRKVRALIPGKPEYPLASFLWPSRGSVSQWEVLPLILMVVGLFRWAAGLWGYSGFQKPPMFGDYEAQRHWMEVTTQLPISQWYFHDLNWWGLDYPPLTAYHSWLCGKIGSLINPGWFALYSSRGLDDENLKIFMRGTVIVSEYLTYVPATIMFIRRLSRASKTTTLEASIALTAILMQPATILVDHVHFQYNTVMLGLVVAYMSSMFAGRYFLGSVFFVLSLGFKQMALYYAPAVFAYLLGSCIFPKINISRFLVIAVSTLASFAILVLPLYIGALYDNYRGIDARPELEGFHAPLPIFSDLSEKLNMDAWYFPIVQQTAQLLYRVFPFARGLFEDKVANFWCAVNVIIKLKAYPIPLLQRASLAATLGAISPFCLIIFRYPKKELLPLALAGSAWGFFLFSFQVHEKSDLLPLMPMTLLLAGRNGLDKSSRAWVGFANMLGVWTLYPLLKRVDLSIPYTVLSLLWAWLLALPPTSLQLYSHKTWVDLSTAVIHLSFYVAMAAWHIVDAFMLPPATKPDLWVVLNVGIGAAGFGICYLWCFWTLYSRARSYQSLATTEKAGKKTL